MHSLNRFHNRLPISTFKLYYSTSPEIIIPPRIERGPTDILAALAGTVGKDKTAPHYRYHDDPWLTPYKLTAKREYALAKESGRKAARFIMSQHPELFDHNRIEAEPPITAIQPRYAYNRDNVTVELLDNLVSNFQVKDSIDVYNLLKEKKKEIPEALYQSLLELVAYYNEEEAIVEGDETRGVISSDMPWCQDGFVVSEYSEGGEASSGQRLAMLLGQGKHRGKVWQMMKECEANNDIVPREAYNFAIEKINQSEGVAKAVEQVKSVLVKMKEAGVAPDNTTLISILTLMAGLAKGKEHQSCCRRALDFLAEFRVLGVEFSLGVYKNLVDVFVPKGDRERHKSPIINDILNEIEDKEFWPAVHHQDFLFFPVAMKTCNIQNNAKLAWRLDSYLHKGKHALLLGDFQMDSIYYTNFLSVVLQNDTFDRAMQLYNDIVPHTCSPMYNFYSMLLNHVHTNGAIQHLPKIWEDMVVSDYGSASRENTYMLTNQMLQVLRLNDPSHFELTGMSEAFVSISSQIFKHLQDKKADKKLYLRFNTVAATICDNVIFVALREGNFDLAASVIKFCVAEKTVMPGYVKNETLEQYIDVCIDLVETERAMEAVEYCVDIKSPSALAVGLKIVDKLELQSDQKDYLNKLYSTYSEWVNI